MSLHPFSKILVFKRKNDYWISSFNDRNDNIIDLSTQLKGIVPGLRYLCRIEPFYQNKKMDYKIIRVKIYIDNIEVRSASAG